MLESPNNQKDLQKIFFIPNLAELFLPLKSSVSFLLMPQHAKALLEEIKNKIVVATIL